MSNSTPEIKQYIRKKLYEDYNQGTQIDLQNAQAAAIEAERKKKAEEMTNSRLSAIEKTMSDTDTDTGLLRRYFPNFAKAADALGTAIYGDKDSIERDASIEADEFQREVESSPHGQRVKDEEAKRYKSDPIDLGPSPTTPGTTTPGKIIQTDTEADRLEASKSTLNPPVSDESSFTTAMRQANGGYLSPPNPVESAENVEKVDYQNKYDMNDETTFGQPRLGSSETNYNSQANIDARDKVKKEQKTRADLVYNPADIEVLDKQAGAKKVVPLTPEQEAEKQKRAGVQSYADTEVLDKQAGAKKIVRLTPKEEAEKQKRAGVQSSADTRVLKAQAGAKKPPRRGLRGLGVVEEFKRVVQLGTKGPSFKALLEKTRSR